MSELSYDEKLEKVREKVFFYVSYQKRSEAEIKRTFIPLFRKLNISIDVFNDLIEELKYKGYVDDEDLVRRKFVGYTNSNAISLREIEYKILQKGISKDLITDYEKEHEEYLENHQIKSVNRLYEKKSAEGKSDEEITAFLLRKGFKQDIVNKIIR